MDHFGLLPPVCDDVKSINLEELSSLAHGSFFDTLNNFWFNDKELKDGKHTLDQLDDDLRLQMKSAPNFLIDQREFDLINQASQRKPIKIVVFGSEKTGKSSFLNALLGINCLPVSSLKSGNFENNRICILSYAPSSESCIRTYKSIDHYNHGKIFIDKSVDVEAKFDDSSNASRTKLFSIVQSLLNSIEHSKNGKDNFDDLIIEIKFPFPQMKTALIKFVYIPSRICENRNIVAILFKALVPDGIIFAHHRDFNSADVAAFDCLIQSLPSSKPEIFLLNTRFDLDTFILDYDPEYLDISMIHEFIEHRYQDIKKIIEKRWFGSTLKFEKDAKQSDNFSVVNTLDFAFTHRFKSNFHNLKCYIFNLAVSKIVNWLHNIKSRQIKAIKKPLIRISIDTSKPILSEKLSSHQRQVEGQLELHGEVHVEGPKEGEKHEEQPIQSAAHFLQLFGDTEEAEIPKSCFTSTQLLFLFLWLARSLDSIPKDKILLPTPNNIMIANSSELGSKSPIRLQLNQSSLVASEMDAIQREKLIRSTFALTIIQLCFCIPNIDDKTRKDLNIHYLSKTLTEENPGFASLFKELRDSILIINNESSNQDDFEPLMHLPTLQTWNILHKLSSNDNEREIHFRQLTQAPALLSAMIAIDSEKFQSLATDSILKLLRISCLSDSNRKIGLINLISSSLTCIVTSNSLALKDPYSSRNCVNWIQRIHILIILLMETQKTGDCVKLHELQQKMMDLGIVHLMGQLIASDAKFSFKIIQPIVTLVILLSYQFPTIYIRFLFEKNVYRFFRILKDSLTRKDFYDAYGTRFSAVEIDKLICAMLLMADFGTWMHNAHKIDERILSTWNNLQAAPFFDFVLPSCKNRSNQTTQMVCQKLHALSWTLAEEQSTNQTSRLYLKKCLQNILSIAWNASEQSSVQSYFSCRDSLLASVVFHENQTSFTTMENYDDASIETYSDATMSTASLMSDLSNIEFDDASNSEYGSIIHRSLPVSRFEVAQASSFLSLSFEQPEKSRFVKKEPEIQLRSIAPLRREPIEQAQCSFSLPSLSLKEPVNYFKFRSIEAPSLKRLRLSSQMTLDLSLIERFCQGFAGYLNQNNGPTRIHKFKPPTYDDLQTAHFSKVEDDEILYPGMIRLPTPHHAPEHPTQYSFSMPVTNVVAHTSSEGGPNLLRIKSILELKALDAKSTSNEEEQFKNHSFSRFNVVDWIPKSFVPTTILLGNPEIPLCVIPPAIVDLTPPGTIGMVEFKIVDAGETNSIVLGVTYNIKEDYSPSGAYNRVPGNTPYSIGIHAQTGNIKWAFGTSTVVYPYSSPFGTGSKVSIGIIATGYVYFVVNGRFGPLVPFKMKPANIHALVHIACPGVKLSALPMGNQWSISLDRTSEKKLVSSITNPIAHSLFIAQQKTFVCVHHLAQHGPLEYHPSFQTIWNDLEMYHSLPKELKDLIESIIFAKSVCPGYCDAWQWLKSRAFKIRS